MNEKENRIPLEKKSIVNETHYDRALRLGLLRRISLRARLRKNGVLG